MEIQDLIITSENINLIKNYKNPLVEITNDNGVVSIKFDTMPPPLFYFINEDEKYFFSFNEDALMSYLLHHGEIKEAIVNPFYEMVKNKQVSERYIKSNKYPFLFYIVNYENLKIKANGLDYDIITDYYSVPIREAGYIVYKWLRKYKEKIKSISDRLVPELSAGMDTRSLTYFWRDLHNVPTVYSKITEHGLDIEVPVVKSILSRIFDEQKLVHHKISGYVTLSGKGITSSASKYNNKSHLNHDPSLFTPSRYFNQLMPYKDRDFMRIRPEHPWQLKTVMQVLLAKDLMDIPYYSAHTQLFTFTDEMIKEAEDIIKQWNLDQYEQ